MKKMNFNSTPGTRVHRRPPSTPPLPLRTLQLVARQPDSPVVSQEHRRVRGRHLAVRESWPSTRVTSDTHTARIPEAIKASSSGRGSNATMMSLLLFCHSSSNSLVAIDNKIEQAMDLVKSHLMLAVREEVELLREQIRELQEKNAQLERENCILRTITHTH